MLHFEGTLDTGRGKGGNVEKNGLYTSRGQRDQIVTLYIIYKYAQNFCYDEF